MTPSEILQRFKQTDSADFLSELPGDDLWGFLEMRFSGFVYWALDIDTFETYEELHALVVAEAHAEMRAQQDMYNNLWAARHEIKQDWIDDLEDHRDNAAWIRREVSGELIAWLKSLQFNYKRGRE